MVLQDRHDGARYGAQRAVERGQRLDLLAVADPDGQAPGLELGAVRGRGQLAVLALRRDPRLAVELAGGRGAEVTGGDVDHAERQLQRGQPLLLPRQQALVLGLGVRGVDVREHLDLVELVHAEDAPGVLAVRTGLAAEAGREARVPQRQLVGVEDLVHVVRRERHLGGADQVEVVLVEVVDVLRGLAEEAGAGHRLRADQRRGQHRSEAGRGGLGHRRVHQGQLQQGADTGEEVEAGAGDLGAALDVDRAEQLPEFQMVLGFKALGTEVADGAVRLQGDEVLLAADGDVGVDEVAEPEQQLMGLGVGRVALGVGGLDVGLELLGPLEQLGLLVGGGLGDQLAELLLLGTQFVEADAGRPAPLVGGQEGVDERDILSTSTLGRAHTVGVLTEQAKVNHRPKATGAGMPLTNHYYGALGFAAYGALCANCRARQGKVSHSLGRGRSGAPG
ncbi:protein of unknown function [Streptomyces murinus]